MIERKFIKENMRKSAIDEFLSNEFSKAGFSHSDIQRTPLATRVVVFAQKPGIVIGRGGKTIDMLAETLKEKFGLENPQVDVQEISNPDLDAAIVAKQIVTAIERGLNYKRVANLTLKRIIDAGAAGVAIRIGGKVGGEMSRIEKFSAGYLKFAGEPAERMGKAYARAKVKLGIIGVQVRILTELPKERLIAKKISDEIIEEKIKREEIKEEKVEENPKEAKTEDVKTDEKEEKEEKMARKPKTEKNDEEKTDSPEKEFAQEEHVAHISKEASDIKEEK